MSTFTAEQQAEYDKEMQRLEAEAGKTAGKTEVKADTTTSTEKAEAKAEVKTEATETAEQLVARIASTEKALKDTQRWAHENAAKVKRLEREAEERKRTETRPAILDANPGLEDAINHVAARAPESVGQDEWLKAVSHVIPDVETLLGDQAFFAKAKERQVALGVEWDNPLTAIRELSDLKAEHVSNRNTTLALDAARKDFADKAKKRVAMDMPGGSGGNDSAKETDDVKAVWAMSDKDFQAQRAKVMGF